MRFPKVPSEQAAQLPALERYSPSEHITVGTGVGAGEGRGLKVGAGMVPSSPKSEERAPVRVKLLENATVPESHMNSILNDACTPIPGQYGPSGVHSYVLSATKRE